MRRLHHLSLTGGGFGNSFADWNTIQVQFWHGIPFESDQHRSLRRHRREEAYETSLCSLSISTTSLLARMYLRPRSAVRYEVLELLAFRSFSTSPLSTRYATYC